MNTTTHTDRQYSHLEDNRNFWQRRTHRLQTQRDELLAALQALTAVCPECAGSGLIGEIENRNCEPQVPCPHCTFARAAIAKTTD